MGDGRRQRRSYGVLPPVRWGNAHRAAGERVRSPEGRRGSVQREARSRPGLDPRRSAAERGAPDNEVPVGADVDDEKSLGFVGLAPRRYLGVSPRRTTRRGGQRRRPRPRWPSNPYHDVLTRGSRLQYAEEDRRHQCLRTASTKEIYSDRYVAVPSPAPALMFLRRLTTDLRRASRCPRWRDPLPLETSPWPSDRLPSLPQP